MADFIHLRVHSAYSLAQGAIRTKQLLNFCTEQNMPAVAITDNDNCFVGREFSLAAASQGIQPIIGVCLNVGIHKTGNKYTPNDYFLAPVVLLVQNEQGWLSLMHLLKVAYIETADNQPPHISLETLLTSNQGLILLTGGHLGPMGQLILAGHDEKAEEILQSLYKHFSDRLYMEIMRHGLEDEKQTE
ncbi:MAG: PHP domain-containing protein [Alphaproteobacteria bacterium]